MKISKYSFTGGMFNTEKKGSQKAFDWDRAAQLIKERLESNPDLIAEAGLQGDWEYTGGIIFTNGKPTNNHYTFLSSNWATPTLIILNKDGEELEEIACFTTEGRFDCDTKWDSESLNILGISINDESN